MVFTRSEDLEKEFQAMKNAIQEAVKMSPIEKKKKLYAFVDSPLTVGTAYILAQRKDEKDQTNGYNIVSVDSTTFKRAQVQYSPFEAEALGIVWFLNTRDYFTRGAQEIVIFNDAKNMNTFMKSKMNDSYVQL